MRLPAGARTSPARSTMSKAQPSTSSSTSFIIKVQHLIECCLTLDLDEEECVQALSKHANIHPIVTVTVWKELEKANMEFFEHYNRRRLGRRLSHYIGVLQETTNKLSSQNLENVYKRPPHNVNKRSSST